VQGAKIPVWEQELSCGAACMNLMTAAHALGFVAAWITGWPTYSPEVQSAFGREGERIAGFIFIGSPAAELQERPRPDYDRAVAEWSPPLEGG
jgi:nitroreductase